MNPKFYSLPEEKQKAIINAGYRVFSQNSYKNSPMSEIAAAAGQNCSKAWNAGCGRRWRSSACIRSSSFPGWISQ